MTTYVCKCGNRSFDIATTSVTTFDFSLSGGVTEPPADIERSNNWCDASMGTCTECGESNAMAQFAVQEQDLDNMPNADLANLLTDGVQADVWTDAPECQHRISIIHDAMAEAAHRLTQHTLPTCCVMWLNDELNDAEFADELRKHLKPT